MKVTSYILGTMVLATFLLVAAGVVVMYQFSTPQQERLFRLEGNQLTQVLPSCKVLKMNYRSHLNTKTGRPYMDFFSDSRLQIAGTSVSVPLFSFPESCQDFIRVTSQGDTVCLTIDISLEERLKHVNAADQTLRIAIDKLHLQVPPTVQQLTVSLPQMPVQLLSVQQDSLSCAVDGALTVDSCHFRSLAAQADEVHIQSGKIACLYMDLDVVRNWTVQPDSSYIGSEYLKGSRYHYGHIQRGECENLYWLPESPEANLELSLGHSAEVHLLE